MKKIKRRQDYTRICTSEKIYGEKPLSRRRVTLQKLQRTSTECKTCARGGLTKL